MQDLWQIYVQKQLSLPNFRSMNTLSAVIITLNEEKNIGRCVQSLQGIADEIIVVDSFSNDATESICKSLGVKFVKHQWEGYVKQKLQQIIYI